MPTPLDYRDDPRWQAVREDYMRHDPDVSAAVQTLRRLQCARRLFEIEIAYEQPSLTAEQRARLATLLTQSSPSSDGDAA